MLEEVDGPIPRHGLQECMGSGFICPCGPAMLPSLEGLERRYERFRGRVLGLSYQVETAPAKRT